MPLENIVGYVIDASQLDWSSSAPWLGWLFLVIGLLLLGFFINLILFILSCFKYTFTLNDAFQHALNPFKKYFKSIFKYYIPVIILFAYQAVLFGYNEYLMQSTGNGVVDFFSPQDWVLYVILPLLVQFTYYSIVNMSLAKSYYNSLPLRKFVFTWISFVQFIKVCMVTFLYGIVFVLGLPFLMIPGLLLGYMLPLVRYPILFHDKGIMESISLGYHLFKQNFWNVIFYVVIYSAMITLPNSIFNNTPYLGDVVTLFTLLAIQPFATLFLTDFYAKIENKKSKRARRKK
jgi:hypothetical protein